MNVKSGMASGLALLLAACAAQQAKVDPAAACAGLGGEIPASAIGIPSGKATIQSAVLVQASPLAAWVERGQAPEGLEVTQQERAPPFKILRSLPLCRWPGYPHYLGGDAARAGSFECRKPAD